MKKEIQDIANLIKKNKFFDAEFKARNLDEKNPKNFSLLNLLGIALYSQNKLNEAKEKFERSIDAKPDFANGHYNLGNTLRDIGKLNKSIESYNKAIKFSPDFAKAYNNMGMVLQTLKKYDDAIAKYKKAIVIEPKFVEALNNLGIVLNLAGEFENSVKNYIRALELKPEDSSINNNLGISLKNLGKFNEAKNCYKKVIKNEPYYIEAYINLANLLRSEGKFQEGIEVCKKSLEIDPKNFKIHQLLIKLKWENNFENDAFTEILKFIEKNEKPPLDLIDLLSSALISTNQKALLLKLKNKIEINSNKDINYKLRMAEINSSELIKDYESALNTYQEIDIKFSNKNIKLQISKMLFFLGKAKESLSILKDLSKDNELEFLQKVLAFKSHVLKYLKHEEYFELCNYDKFIFTQNIPVPKGWKDLESFNIDLTKELEKLHLSKKQPFDQTLKNGTQTLDDLFFGNNLKNKCILSLKNSLSIAIENYRSRLEKNKEHPFLKNIPKALQINGSWSVRLNSDGYHTNHFHSKGLVSSAYYVSLPEFISTDKTSKNGWLKFGQPGNNKFNLLPDKWIAPKIGMLVLFPSYFWHGTEPFQNKKHRLTVAFDTI